MLRKLRIFAAALFFIGITLMVLDITGTLHHWLSWMAKVQLVPAILALNVIIVAVLLVLTLVMGRIYCSVICPLGIYQDVVWWIRRKVSKPKYKREAKGQHYARTALRLSFLVIFVLLIAIGLTGIASMIAPYSSYARMVETLLQPLYILVNNGLAAIAEKVDSYAFYPAEVWLRSGITLAVTLVLWLIVTTLAAMGGRRYCNTVCPVGTVLGFLSRYSWLKPYISEEKCISCGRCERQCKAHAIDIKNLKIDYSLCVDCFDCLNECRSNAMLFGHPRANKSKSSLTGSASSAKDIDKSKRAFMLASLTVGATAAMAQAEKKVDGGFAVIEEKAIPERKTPILPPGALSAQHLAQHCTTCQLCVSECPNGVLRPSSDLQHFMQPVMSYERGYCSVDCHRCSDVCPTGAIHLADTAEKVSMKIGEAHWVQKNCVNITDGVSCDNCSRHCPSGAIEMIPLKVAPKDQAENPEERPTMIPAVDTTLCIGCGACENLCPARPLAAIIVEGVEHQHTI